MSYGLVDLNKLKKKLIAPADYMESSPSLEGRAFRRAAILVPFVLDNGEWSLLFTRRSETLSNHRGQVSFPGGGMESKDATPLHTAIRETFEEIGLQSAKIDILGYMTEFLTNSNFVVTPVIAKLIWPTQLKINPDEVSRVFTIPINWLRDFSNWEEKPFTHPSGWNGTVVFYTPYDGELLWGISARITLDLLHLLFD